MLKLFEFRQQFWADVLSDLLHYVLLQGLCYGRLGRKAQVEVGQCGRYPMWVVEPQVNTDLPLDVIFPPIVQKHVAVQASTLAKVAAAEATIGQQMPLPSKVNCWILRCSGPSCMPKAPKLSSGKVPFRCAPAPVSA